MFFGLLTGVNVKQYMPKITYSKRPKNVFQSHDTAAECYRAPVIDPLIPDPHVPNNFPAFKDSAGNIIFRIGLNDSWFLLPPNTPEALLLQNGEQPNIEGLAALAAHERTALRDRIGNKSITYIAQPDNRKIEHVFRLPNEGDWIVVSIDTNNGVYADRLCRVFKGRALTDLQELDGVHVRRFRDGGSAIYQTTQGTLNVPKKAGMGESNTPTWQESGKSDAVVLMPQDINAASTALASNTNGAVPDN